MGRAWRDLMHRQIIALGVLVGSILLAGCELGMPRGGPTPTILQEAAPTETPVEPTMTQGVTLTPIPQLESPSPAFTPGLPTETLTRSPAPGPMEDEIQPGHTLLYIIQQDPFNYTDTIVIPEILRLN